MSEWQPIETAPKDGTFILVYACAPIPRVALAAWQGRGQRAGWYGVDDCGLTFDAVRHGDLIPRWMYLPGFPE